MTDLEEDLVNELTGNLSLVKNTNLFAGEIKDIRGLIPDYAVFCRGISGTAADRVFQLVYEISKPQVSVYVRSNVNDRETAKAKMQSIYRYLILNCPDGYLDCRCLQSSPQNLGEDDKGRYIYTMTFECWKQENQWILDDGYWVDTKFWADAETWDDGV